MRISEIHASLKNRCNLLNGIFKTIEVSAIFTRRDAKKLITQLNELKQSALHVSDIEIELGMKSRELVKRNLEYSALKNKYESLHKRSIVIEV